MIAYFHKFIENYFQVALKKGDIVWYINDLVSNITGNGYMFGVTLMIISYCSVEIAGNLYALTQKPTLDQILRFAPMFFASVHVLSCCLLFVVHKYDYTMIYNAYFDVWPLKPTDKESVLEIRNVFHKALITTFIFLVIAVSGVIGLMPYHVNIEQTIWPVLAVLTLIPDVSPTIQFSVALLNSLYTIFKAYFLLIYNLHYMQLCILYQVQSILLKRRLNSIKCNILKVPQFELVEHKGYQIWVSCQLKTCIKVDIKLKRFAEMAIVHFKWATFIHTSNGTLLITMLLYAIVGQDTLPCPVAFKVFLLGCNLTAFMYTHFSEVFYEQVGNSLTALF
nr:odorant receptor 31 [Pachyrhinus yasumatsui]